MLRMTVPALTALVLIETAVGCYAPISEDIAGAGAEFETGTAARDLHVTADDLACSQDIPRIGRMRVTNLLGLTEQTEAVARSPTGGTYPVGTLLLGNPYEIMVKRGPGFSEATGDWEFLFVEASEEGTIILDRGTTEVMGLAPIACIDCHAQAEPQWDYVCQHGHGCADNPVIGPVFEALFEGDPRCGHRIAPAL